MALFKKATCEAAYLKMGLLGFAGSGKTYTASLVAKGLYKAAIKKEMPYAGRPVFFFDTEGGSDYLVEDFDKSGIELQVLKSRAFSDLVAAVKEAESNASVLIVDSISHVWLEFQKAYKEKKKRYRGLAMNDWMVLKEQWRSGFTDPYINSNLHILMCGRAAFEYDHYEDDDGKKQIAKSGVKMSAEKELGFEPSLLVAMEKETDPETAQVTRKAVVMKDRFRVLDGKEFQDPTFKDFCPHIEKLNWGGKQNAVDTSRTSSGMVEPDAKDRSVERKVALDLISNVLTKHFGTSKDDKKNKIELLEATFGTSSDTHLEKRMSLEDLQAGCNALYETLGEELSPYSANASKPRVRLASTSEAIDDDLPEAAA